MTAVESATPSLAPVLPVSLLAGGAFLVLADLVARVVLAPAELPLGVVTLADQFGYNIANSTTVDWPIATSQTRPGDAMAVREPSTACAFETLVPGAFVFPSD